MTNKNSLREKIAEIIFEVGTHPYQKTDKICSLIAKKAEKNFHAIQGLKDIADTICPQGKEKAVHNDIKSHDTMTTQALAEHLGVPIWIVMEIARWEQAKPKPNSIKDEIARIIYGGKDPSEPCYLCADRILSLIAEKVEGMRKDKNFDDSKVCNGCKRGKQFCQCDGYNQALDDIKKEMGA